MITDPPTGVSSRRGRTMVVTLVALVEMLLRLLEQVNAPLYALFLVGPPALILDLLRKQTASPRELARAVGTPT